jgi:hypothetical protein
MVKIALAANCECEREYEALELTNKCVNQEKGPSSVVISFCQQAGGYGSRNHHIKACSE